VNDSSAPVQIVGGKVEIQASPWATYFTYQPQVNFLLTSRPISALELRYVLLDFFGNPIGTIGELLVQDVPQTDKFTLPPNQFDTMPALRPKKGKQPAVEDRPPGILEAPVTEVQRLISVVTFVARVRAKEGQIWNHDPAGLSSEIGKRLGIDFKPDALQSNRQRK
jgi:hypothetical protein